MGKKVTGSNFAFLKVFKYKNGYLGTGGWGDKNRRLRGTNYYVQNK